MIPGCIRRGLRQTVLSLGSTTIVKNSFCCTAEALVPQGSHHPGHALQLTQMTTFPQWLNFQEEVCKLPYALTTPIFIHASASSSSTSALALIHSSWYYWDSQLLFMFHVNSMNTLKNILAEHIPYSTGCDWLWGQRAQGHMRISPIQLSWALLRWGRAQELDVSSPNTISPWKAHPNIPWGTLGCGDERTHKGLPAPGVSGQVQSPAKAVLYKEGQEKCVWTSFWYN